MTTDQNPDLLGSVVIGVDLWLLSGAGCAKENGKERWG
jgi:hypothetical protein